jgi:MMP 1-O-methyltransferase
MLPDNVHDINGFLSVAEAELLYRLAVEVPQRGAVVEIGSFQGRSTVCLGLGAKQAGAGVWAVDPHEDCQVNENTHYGMENHAALLKNLVDFEVADVVRVIAMPSALASSVWYYSQIHLLWIDGSHERDDVWADLRDWHYHVSINGKIALHDASGHFPGVTQALDDFLARNKWRIAQRIDATVVLERDNV